MKQNTFSQIKSIIMKNLSINILVLMVIVYLAVMNLISGKLTYALMLLAAGILYVIGAKLGEIRKYLPLVFAIISSCVFVVGFLFVIMGKSIPNGMAAYAAVVIFYVLTGFDGIVGNKCIPYAVAMFGAEIILSFNGDSRGMIILIAALLLSVMFAKPTYTAMSKYVFTVFLSICMVKITGIWHIFMGTSPVGLTAELVESPALYVIMVFLGIISLLLRERHPRIKSDRDKKEVPVLRQWQYIIGLSILMVVFWGVLNFYSVFDMKLSGVSENMKINLVYLVGSTMVDGSFYTKILASYGFFPLMLVIMTMISIVYKAILNYKNSNIMADKLFVLMMIGFLLAHAYYNVCVPVLFFYMLFAGCVVNGEEKESQAK